MYLLKYMLTCIACFCAGCIPIPVHHDVPTETETTQTSVDDINNFRLAPYYHKSSVREFEQELTDASDNIEIVESTSLWLSAFPDRELDSEATLGELLAPETIQLLAPLDLQSVIIIKPATSSTGEDSFVFAGAAFGGSEEQTTKMSALVLDMDNATNAEQLMTTAEGKSRAAWVFIPLPLINFFYWDFSADTEASAKEGLAEAFADRLLKKYDQRPVRITVLGSLAAPVTPEQTDGTPLVINRRVATDSVYGLSNDQLEWKASLGNSEAQLQLYWNLATPDRLLWLCRSADQEHPDAQKRLGILYAAGAENVPHDQPWAYVWYSKAASNGDFRSGEAAGRIVSNMNKQDSLTAQERLDAWTPGQCKTALQAIWSEDASPMRSEEDDPPVSQ
jgi:hypothetical protein